MRSPSQWPGIRRSSTFGGRTWMLMASNGYPRRALPREGRFRLLQTFRRQAIKILAQFAPDARIDRHIAWFLGGRVARGRRATWNAMCRRSTVATTANPGERLRRSATRFSALTQPPVAPRSGVASRRRNLRCLRGIPRSGTPFSRGSRFTVLGQEPNRHALSRRSLVPARTRPAAAVLPAETALTTSFVHATPYGMSGVAVRFRERFYICILGRGGLASERLEEGDSSSKYPGGGSRSCFWSTTNYEPLDFCFV
jgi:hypothetical protein